MAPYTTHSPYPFYSYYLPQLFVHDSSNASTSDPSLMYEPYSDVGGSGLLGLYPTDSLMSSSNQPSELPQAPSFAETEKYLRKTMGIDRSERVDLWAHPRLKYRTISNRPSTTEMIRLAIWGSRDKRLTLAQIYDAIEERYPELKNMPAEEKAWQRSIRHNLSLKAIFEQVDRPRGHRGKGKYWVLNVRHGEANKRPQNRKKRTVKSTEGLSADSNMPARSTSTSYTTSFSPSSSIYHGGSPYSSGSESGHYMDPSVAPGMLDSLTWQGNYINDTLRAHYVHASKTLEYSFNPWMTQAVENNPIQPTAPHLARYTPVERFEGEYAKRKAEGMPKRRTY